MTNWGKAAKLYNGVPSFEDRRKHSTANQLETNATAPKPVVFHIFLP